MNKLFPRVAPVVVLCLPLSGFAQSTRPDPADPSTPAPALHYRSTFADYKPWQDIKPGNWRAVNDQVRDAAAEGGGHAGHGMAMPPPAPAASAPSPAMPRLGGHSMQGGKP